MYGFSHVILHVALCKSVARLAPETSVAVHVVLANPVRKPQVDEVLHIRRGSSERKTIEVEVPTGVYHLSLDVPEYGCSDVEFLAVLPLQDRQVYVNLAERGTTSPEPAPDIVAGTIKDGVPIYVHPTVVVFPRTVKCKGPVGEPVPDLVENESSFGAYYASIFSLKGIEEPGSRVVALRLTSASGGHHYIRIPVRFPPSPAAWASFQRFDVTMGMIDAIATKPDRTLLCPHFSMTSAG